MLIYILGLLIIILSILLFLQRFKKVEASYHDQSQMVEQYMDAKDFASWRYRNDRY